MFRPNQQGQLLRKNRRRDIHGRESFDNPVPLPLSIVHLEEGVKWTSVRADSSASRGSAEQTELQAKLLVPTGIAMKKGDVIKVLDHFVEVEAMHTRLDVMGRPHHVEVKGNIKGDM
jgi:hypothetical protein